MIGIFQGLRRTIHVKTIAGRTQRMGYIPSIHVIFNSTAHKSLVFIARLAHHPTWKMIFAHAFIGLLHIKSPDAFLISTDNKGRRAGPRHDIGIISTRRTSRNQTPILVHREHRIHKGLCDFRIYQMPECIDRPLGAPHRIKIMMPKLRFSIRIQGNLTRARRRPRHIQIFSIHVTDDPTAL